ncbi:MAG: glycosyltransferase family 2 protein [Candidatus Zixiibacteriota bacterium]
MNAVSTLVIVPAYNASDHLPELVTRLRQFVCEENMLFVNDGSTDNTLKILQLLKVNHLSFQSNRGKGAALAAAFAYAAKRRYRSVLTIDADLQHLPEEIPAFFAEEDGRRLVIGTRHMDLRVMPFGRWLTNNLSSLIISVFSARRIRDSQSGYRLIPVWLLGALPMNTHGYDFESEMLFKAGAVECPVAEVPIKTVYEGSLSYINPLADTGRFVRQIWRRIWA